MKSHTHHSTGAAILPFPQRPTSGKTVASWLLWSRTRLAADEGLLMLAQLLRREKSWLLAHGETLLSRPQRNRLMAWVSARRRGHPLSQLIGREQFYGLDLVVTRHVLGPRPETEGLVDIALEKLPLHGELWDLGTGSGCIALAAKQTRRDAEVLALDISTRALAVAALNRRRLRLPLALIAANWLASLSPHARAHVIVANPPYVAEGDSHLRNLAHEPQCALVAGENGFACLNHLIQHAPRYLHNGGWLLLEHGHDQGATVCAAMESVGLLQVSTCADLAGHPRITLGQKKL